MKCRGSIGSHAGRDGSSLLLVLVMVAVFSVLAAVVLRANLAQYRFIRRDVHRLQARYAAEAGVYAAMDSLRRDPYWMPRHARVPLPLGQESRVTIEPFGGYLWIRSEARYRRSRGIVRALVGEIPPPAFHDAIYLWDTESSLHVAGRTRVTGDVVVGRRGLKRSTFKRRRFTGSIDGAVRQVPGLEAPFFDGTWFRRAVDDAEALLHAPPRAAPGPLPPPEGRLPGDMPVVVIRRTLRLNAADSLLLREALTLIVHGDVTFSGPLHVPPGTRVVATGTLRLGGVEGREALFYGREGIEIEGAVRCAGQFFSRASIRVARGAVLGYPSVLYVTGEAAETGGGIHVEGGAAVNGTLVHPPLDPPPVIARGRIVVDPLARVRGAVFNAHETELHGTVVGAVLTHRFYFYEPPTSYVNWLKDAVIDAPGRPVKYVLPRGFSPVPYLAVLRWDAHVDETAPLR